MPKESYYLVRRGNLLLFIVGLSAVVVGLGVLLWGLYRAAQMGEGGQRDRYVLALFIITGVLLVLVIFMAGLAAIRWMLHPVRPGRRAEPTPYVDAWAEAGQRAAVPGDEDREPPDEPPPESRN